MVCAWCVHGVCMVCAWCVHGVCMHGIRIASRCRSRCKSLPLHLPPSNQCLPRQSLRQRGSTPTRVGLSSDLTRIDPPCRRGGKRAKDLCGVIAEWGCGAYSPGVTVSAKRRGSIVDRTVHALLTVRENTICEFILRCITLWCSAAVQRPHRPPPGAAARHGPAAGCAPSGRRGTRGTVP
jgi:hypothetical protein